MTKNRKIKLLINDNKRLLKENKRLQNLSNKNISSQIISDMKRYSAVIEKLNEKYIELNRLKTIGMRNRWRYRMMLLGLKLKKVSFTGSH